MGVKKKGGPVLYTLCFFADIARLFNHQLYRKFKRVVIAGEVLEGLGSRYER